MKNKLILSLISAVSLSVGWLSLSGIPLLFAFVPLLFISESYDKGRRPFWKMFGYVAISFAIWNQATTWWIINTFINSDSLGIGIAVQLLNIVIAVGLFGGMFMLYHWVSKRAHRALAYTLLVAGWIAFEYLYTVGEISFPWLTLGNGFGNDVKIIQWYDTTGVFGGSLWVLISNLLIFEALRHNPRKIRSWIAPALFIAIPVIVSSIRYATYKEEGRELTVTVVQPNIDPHVEKYQLSQRMQTEILLAGAAEAPADADYILMPETAIDESIVESEIHTNSLVAKFRTFLKNQNPNAQIITGATTFKVYGLEPQTSTARSNKYGIFFDIYNTALAIDTSKNTQIYHKSMLLVGVERIPWYDLIRNMNILIIDMGGLTGQLGYDNEPSVFKSDATDNVVAAPICWEGVFGEFCGGFVNKGAEALFIISNDGWWNDTQGHRQLFLFSRLRAIESRRSIARSANTGTSGFVNQRGDIIQKLDWGVRGTLTDTVITNDKITFYTKYGDYIARLSVYVFGLCILYFIAYRVKRRNNLVD